MNASEAGLELVKSMPFGTVFTADARRRVSGRQRLMRTGGGYHFVNADGLPLNAFDLDLASIRDVVEPPGSRSGVVGSADALAAAAAKLRAAESRADRSQWVLGDDKPWKVWSVEADHGINKPIANLIDVGAGPLITLLAGNPPLRAALLHLLDETARHLDFGGDPVEPLVQEANRIAAAINRPDAAAIARTHVEEASQLRGAAPVDESDAAKPAEA